MEISQLVYYIILLHTTTTYENMKTICAQDSDENGIYKAR